MKLTRFDLFALLLVATASFAGDEECEDLLSRSAGEAAVHLESTARFLAYLETLAAEGVLGAEDLQNFARHLEEGRWVNPLRTALSGMGRYVHAQTLQALLASGGLDEARVLTWARARLGESEQKHREREHVRHETQRIYVEMKFHRIPGGPRVPSFELMETDVTQFMWTQRMKQNPAYFQEGPRAEFVRVDGRAFRAQPDNPVENISWWSALVFANRESEARGLKPAYDLSAVEWRPGTSAEAGTLTPLKPDGGFEEIRYNSPSGLLVDTEGFRLPRAVEWIWLSKTYSQQAKVQTSYPFQIPYTDFVQFGIFQDNANGQTQPVGSAARHIVIEGQEFPDLVGNVSKFLSDWLDTGDGEFPMFQVYAGGEDYTMSGPLLMASIRAWWPSAAPARGLRLVRSLRE